jgi:hypothetical protein
MEVPTRFISDIFAILIARGSFSATPSCDTNWALGPLMPSDVPFVLVLAAVIVMALQATKT